jgi:hypothetical protein
MAASKFIQITASPTALYALDAAGDVWVYHTDVHGRNGRWSRLEKRVPAGIPARSDK